MFSLTEESVKRMWQRCNFPIPDHDMIFFGVRGLLPVNQSGTDFADSHVVSVETPDYKHMRCTIGQWKPGHGIALFPGSTVPSNNASNDHVTSAMNKGGFGANQLMLGRYSHRKGKHGLNRKSGHKAFRQAEWFPVWRTKDDLDYDLEDFVDMNLLGRNARPIVWDNIHCGWSQGPENPDYTSAGCQVVAGFPKCEKRGTKPNAGPWKKFYNNAYNIEQKLFHYGLFAGNEALRIASGDTEYSQSLRFNSYGDLVKKAQELLNERGFDVGTPDSKFGPNTLEGLMAFQRTAFAPNRDDGILGPMTAEALGLPLPRVGQTLDDISDEIVPVDPDENDAGISDVLRPDSSDLDDDGPVAATASEVVDAKEIQISSKTENGWKFYFATDENDQKISVGRRLKYGNYKGLGLRTADDAKALPGGKYDPANYVDEHGLWAYFIQPTVAGESFGGYFNCFNCYDRAKFTYGFYQLAAHTPNENLIMFFRRILRLPDAQRFFPDLELVGGKVHRVSGGSTKSLEKKHDDGLLRDFMNYLNPRAYHVDDEEAVNVARLIYWSEENDAFNNIQVGLSIDIAKAKLKRAISKGVPIEGRPIWHAIWVNDNLHQGRAKYTQLKSALNKSDVDSAMTTVGISENYPGRIKTVRRWIKKLNTDNVFDGMQFGDGPFEI